MKFLENDNLFLFLTYFQILTFLHRLFPKKVELQALMKFYDIDHDGNISYEEFMRGLR